ncbi:aa3-type cytochrome oxidase subunit III [Gulosibacter chungangensis]|uniref:cytochrome-c oxidase n=1 Tax=Gulosibacter chungangensis TaxID=979746 RepID=A0A7J5BCV4_9MICO|nr:heme-copper oxidase subunit III [Gulosibacter chungangensis]KAB1644011.1 heme-copper oxidase subunit III [Gulosibacter chungangensis]
MGTVTSLNPASSAPRVHRPNTVAIGTIVWLGSEVMFFAGLFAIFFTLRAMAPEQFAAGHDVLNIPFAVINTLILVSSSVTCQLGVMAAERGQRFRIKGKGWGTVEWYYLSAVLGSIFMGGQVWEYATLVSEGYVLNLNAYTSVFFMSTGFHGLHVLGGILAFFVVIARLYAVKKMGQREMQSAMAISYYWHFVDVVWVGLFFVIYLLPFIA